MTKCTDKLYDVRFKYDLDNPFSGSNCKENLQELKKEIEKNVDKYRTVDWIEDSKCFNIPFPTSGIALGEELSEKLKDNKRLCFRVCDALRTVNNDLKNKLSDELNEYISANIGKNPTPLEESIEEEEEDVSEKLLNEYNDFADVDDTMIYKSFSDSITYNITSGKLISYDELCKLCLSISRSQFVDVVKKDESVIFAENRERTKLVNELKAYKEISEISSRLNVDDTNLSISQLHQVIERARSIHNKMKVKKILTGGLDMLDIGINTFIPNGIPIPWTKKNVKINNFPKATKMAAFDQKSPLSLSIDLLIDKNNVHVSDNLMTLFALGSTFLKEIEVIDRPEEEVSDESEKDPDVSGDEDENEGENKDDEVSEE